MTRSIRVNIDFFEDPDVSMDAEFVAWVIRHAAEHAQNKWQPGECDVIIPVVDYGREIGEIHIFNRGPEWPSSSP